MGLRVSAPSTDPSGKSLSTSNEVSSARVDQAAFSFESGMPTPKGMTLPTQVATRNSWLWCTVLTLPATSFISYVGMPSVTWQTTTCSVSLHQSLTLVCVALHQYHVIWYYLHGTCGSVIVPFLFFGLTIRLEVCLSIGLLEASSNLCHVCRYMMGVLEHTHHWEIMINREVRAPPEHQIM